MTLTLKTWKAALLIPLTVLCACGPPPLEEVTEKTGRSFASLTGEAWDAVADSTNGSTALLDFVNALNLTQADLGLTAIPRPNIQSRATAQATLDEAEKFLKEKVFVKDNVESSGPGGIVFLLRGKAFCGSFTTAASIASCEKAIDDQQIRVAVSGNPDARLVLDIAMGPNRYSPVTVVLDKDRAIEISFRLDQYRALLDELSAASASPLPYATQIEAFEGEYRMRLEKLGPKDFAISFDVTRDVKMNYRGVDKELRTYVLGARSPMYRVRFDGIHHTQEMNIDIGPIAWTLPVSDVTGVKETGPFAVSLQGMKFDIATAAVSPSIAKGRLSLMPMRATYGGSDVVDLPGAHTADFEVGTGPDGRLKVTSTDVDVKARFRFSSVPGWKGDLAALGDEQWRVKLTGPGAAVKLSSVGGPGKNARLALKLIAGTFSIEALTAQDTLTVPTGVCAVKRETPNGTGPLASFGTASCQ